MKLKFSSTTALVLGLVALSAWYVLYEKKWRPQSTAEKEEAKKIVGISKDNIQELEIRHSDGQQFKLKKAGTQWLITAPVEDEADSGVIGSLLNELSSSQEERVIEDNPTQLELYGLDKPAVTVEIFQDANHSEQLFLGAPTQVGSGVYVRTSKKAAVVKVNKLLLTAFQKSLFELRNKRLLQTPQDAVEEVEISNASGQLLIKRTADKKWILAREGSPVDTNAWGKTLNALLEAKATSVASEQADVKKFSLDRPWIKVSISTTPQEPKITLLISQVSGKAFAKTEAKPFIYEVDKSLLKELSQPTQNYKDLHLVSFNRFGVKKIKIQQKGQVTELQKEGPAWKFSDSKPDEKVDAGKVEALLTQLQDAKVSDWVPAQPAVTSHLSVEIFESKDNQEVLAAKLDLGLPQQGKMMGKSGYHKSVWKIESKNLDLVTPERKTFLETTEPTPKGPEKRS